MKFKKDTVLDKTFFERVRERLNLTEKDLSDKTIKSVMNLSNKLIGEWVINNADGFRIKDNGIIIVSKFLPKCLKGDTIDKLEMIENLPIPDYLKETFKKRYEKALSYYRDHQKGTPHINLHSFFYMYKIIWFNSRNCKTSKAELYELRPGAWLNKLLREKIVTGKDYYEWQFSDFRERLKKDKEERKYQKELKKKAKQEEEDELRIQLNSN